MNDKDHLVGQLTRYYPSHPLIAFEHLSLYIHKHSGVVTTNLKLDHKRIYFAGHWETVVNSIVNIEKCQQWLIL